MAHKTKLKEEKFPYPSISGLKRKITNWFNEQNENEDPLTISGLALELGVCKDTIRRWAGKRGDEGIPEQLDDKQKEELKDTMREALLMCENYAEKRLFSSKYVTGAIFSLKSQFGYSEKEARDTSDPLGRLVVEIVNKGSSDSLVKDKNKKKGN